MNKVIISGFVGTEPIARFTNNGNQVLHFAIAVRKGRRTEDGTYPTNFFDVDAWGQVAEIGNARITKGDFVTIEGRLDNDVYEQGGKRQTRTKIIAEHFEFRPDLKEREAAEHVEAKEETVSESTLDLQQVTEKTISTESITYNGVTEEEIPF